ncbi:MAG TPA: D-xylose ABC transporter ATP-binding protein [Firmicutes bacterium]|nr:D-xylose ABC transporter ATP-binding protein [Bacillota bacterium]
MENIHKSFPGVKALNNCQFDLRLGEVHALVGENGAGKSTLMKILTGIYVQDEGTIYYKGSEVQIPSPRSALDLGISIIHQEFNLVPHLTVAQNVFIGREPRKHRVLLNEKAINQQTKELLETLNIDLDPRSKVMDLTVAEQQMVEIAKAVSYNSAVLVMDEPTAALADSEIGQLFTIMRKLKADGVGIIYISHRLEELKQISDRISVLRDGAYIGTVETKEVEVSKIISMMVGRELYETFSDEAIADSGEVVLEVRNMTRKDGLIQDVSFTLKRGEILGFSGLLGAGRTEVARAIFGADPLSSGEVYLRGKKVNISSPADAAELGIGYLSEDRRHLGLALGLDVTSNVGITNYDAYKGKFGWVKTNELKKSVGNLVDILNIKTPSIDQRVANLSGGNQQKTVIAKWLVRDSDILIFDEPTRGIDVGAKNEIYKLLNDLVAEGKSIIMISSDLPEVLRMSHRIIVMCEGRITGELSRKEASQESIMSHATTR